MALTLIRKVEKEDLLENKNYKEQRDLMNIYGSIDHSRLSESEKDEFQTFVNEILEDNTKVINNYYLYENECEDNFSYKLCDIRDDHEDLRRLWESIRDNVYYRENENVRVYLRDWLLSKDIKGIRDNTPLLKLVNMYLRYCNWGNDEISRILEKLQYKMTRKYIVSISNAGYSQLTSSWSSNYSSCYELCEGGYRASNVYLMGDYNNYIVKIFQHTDGNMEKINDDSLKVSRGVISRFNFYCQVTDKPYILVNKVYGSYEFTTSQNYKPLVKSLLSELGVNDIELYESSECFNCLENGIYCYDFHGYEDYTCNVKYRNMQDRSAYANLTIGADKHITWDIECEDMIMIYGEMFTCCDCGYETCDEDELYYCEDTDDYRCGECSWWCDYDGCHYSLNTAWVETPDGERYRQESCYFS
jgi:hypothetical protein